MAQMQYKTGTVTVTNGDATVTGLGTLFVANLAAGAIFKVDGDTATYVVGSITSDTALELTANYTGTTGGSKTYAIHRDFSVNRGYAMPNKGEAEFPDLLREQVIKKIDEDMATKANLVSPVFSGIVTAASLIGNKIYPAADSTTAIQILKANGTTPVVMVDTTNGRVGIGAATGLAQILSLQGITSNLIAFFNSAGITKGYIGQAYSTNDALVGSLTGDMIIRSESQKILFSSSGNSAAELAITAGNIGIRTTTPTAALHLPAGTTVANKAPLQFTSGPVEATPRAGLVEYNGRFIVTESDAANRYLVQAASSTKTTAGAPYTNDGYVSMTVNGTTHKFMTTA